MVSRIVEYLNALVATQGSIERMYGMTQRIQYEGKEVPFCYVGNGEFRPIEIDGGSISYWALNGEVQPFEQVDGYKSEKPLKRTFPLRFVAMVRRDDTEPTSYAEDISNLLTGYSNDLRLQLLAQSVNIVAGFDVDSSKIWRSEFAEISQEVNFTRFMVRIDMTVTVVANRACWQSCDTLPDILQGFDWCNPATIERLLPAQIACITEQLCTPPTLCELIEVATAVEVVDCLSDEQYTEVQDIVCEPCAPATFKINTVTVATPASGTIEDIDVVNGGSNPVGAWDGTSFVIGNNYTEINGVQVTDQEAEVNAAIEVTLDGSQSGSWNAGLQRWEVTSPPCSPVTFQINGVTKETPASGSTFNLIATLDGVAGGTYTPATDTLAFTSATGWIRPAEWIAMPTLTAADERFYGIVAIFENRYNEIAMRLPASACNINWGDGTSVVSNGAQQIKVYNYATLSATVNVWPNGENYKQVLVDVTRIGGAITIITFQNQTTINALGGNNFIDINMSLPNTTLGIELSGLPASNLRSMSLLQRLQWWSVGALTYYNFSGLSSLRSLRLPASFGSSSLAGAFTSAGLIEDCGDLNFGTCTNVSNFFSASNLKKHGNYTANSVVGNGFNYAIACVFLTEFGTINSTSQTSFDLFFYNCFNLAKVGLITVPAATNLSSMFSGCWKIGSVQFANCATVTTTTSMFHQCTQLFDCVMPNLTRGVSFSGSAMANYGMSRFANSIGTASGAQTITITGTPFGALVTAGDATALAIRAVLTGKGYTIAN